MLYSKSLKVCILCLQHCHSDDELKRNFYCNSCELVVQQGRVNVVATYNLQNIQIPNNNCYTKSQKNWIHYQRRSVLVITTVTVMLFCLEYYVEKGIILSADITIPVL